MEKMTIKELVTASRGVQMLGGLDAAIEGIVIDSRKANKDNAFVAIIGENLDGHKFIQSAYDNGCRTFIVSDRNVVLLTREEVINVIRVEDTQLAMGYIGTYYKEKFNIPYIGVTGSVGKTTTRDMVYAALTGKFNAHKNVGNLNNHLGVPLTLFDLKSEHECAVLEMGMSHFGEIEYLVDMVHPEIAVISNVGLSHVENLGSQEGVLKAKLEITKNFTKDSLLVINGDDEMLSSLKGKDLNYRLKTFGFNQDNDLYCKDYTLSREKISFVCEINGADERFEVPTIGEHNILNAMSAILVSLELGLTLDEIRAGLNNYVATGMRLDITETDKYTVINDCYNASPTSMKSSLKVLAGFDGLRKVAILGDIFEMGDMAEIGHREVGKAAVDCADVLITVGKDSAYISNEAYLNGFDAKCIYHFEDKAILINALDGILKKDDVILIKASRGMKLEDIVNNILDK